MLTKYITDFQHCGNNIKDWNKLWILIAERLGLHIKTGDVSNKHIDIYIYEVLYKDGD